MKGTYHVARQIENFNEGSLHPFTLAAYKMEHGQQVFKQYNNIYKQAVTGEPPIIIYIDS